MRLFTYWQKSSLITIRWFDVVYVGSDSTEILEETENHGAVPIRRDEDACDEHVSSANQMIGDFVKRISADHIIWAHCTNPFIHAEICQTAIDLYFNNLPADKDSLISVTKIQSHMWNEFFYPSNYNPEAPTHTLTKDLAPVYFQDGGFFIQPYRQALANSYFFGRRPFLFEVDPIIGFDINKLSDLDMARVLATALDKADVRDNLLS